MRVSFRLRGDAVLPGIGFVAKPAGEGYWSEPVEVVAQIGLLRPLEHQDPEHPLRHTMPGKLAYLTVVDEAQKAPASQITVHYNVPFDEAELGRLTRPKPKKKSKR